MTLVLNLQFLDCQTDEETRLLVTALGQIASYKPGLTRPFGFLKSFQSKAIGWLNVNRSNAAHLCNARHGEDFGLVPSCMTES